MRANAKWLILPSLVLLAACAGMQRKAQERDTAQKWMQTAETDIQTARQAGAETYAPDELDEAVWGLKAAKEKFQIKDYSSALSSAQSASSAAREAKSKSEGAKRKETERKARKKK